MAFAAAGNHDGIASARHGIHVSSVGVRAIHKSPAADAQGATQHPREWSRMMTHIRTWVLLTLIGWSLPSTTSGQREDYRLHAAALAGDVSIVQSLLAEGVMADARDANGRTPLFFAAAANQPTVIAQLTAYGVLIDPVDGDGFSPLMIAADPGACGVCEGSARVEGERVSDQR